jgi:dTDP-4-dehydrorhamnose reductase
MEIRILVLGHTGMLGHMVVKYLKTKNLNIETTDLRWPSSELKEFLRTYDGDFIINCIGAIHQRTNSFDVNWELPIFLDFNTKCRIIHPGTDCEMDDDDYGRSKKIARDYIVNLSKKTKSLKTSILGPEINGKFSLMEWFLSNKNGSTVSGYSQYYWNGNTTLTWSKICYDLIMDWDNFENEIIISSNCISKKAILESLKLVFERDITIIDNNNIVFNKCLDGQISTPHIVEQLKELKEFYYD